MEPTLKCSETPRPTPGLVYWLVVNLLWTGYTVPVWAEEVVPGSEAPDLAMATVKMVGVLVLMIAGLFLAVHLLKKLGAAKSGLFGGSEVVRIIATRALAPKKYIAVVEVGNSVLTLGLTTDQISCLDKVPVGEFRAAMAAKTGLRPEPGFAEHLKTAPPSATTSEAET